MNFIKAFLSIIGFMTHFRCWTLLARTRVGGRGPQEGGAADAAGISEMENKTENEEIPVIGWGNDVEGEVDISAC